MIRKVASEVVVLLKNEDNILPSQKSKETLAPMQFMHPTQVTVHRLLLLINVVSPLEGISENFGKEKLVIKEKHIEIVICPYY